MNLNPSKSVPITNDNMHDLKSGDCVVTPMGTGFFKRLGVGCVDRMDCGCSSEDLEAHCRVAVPLIEVHHDGGATSWVELEGCYKLN